ncbi:MAG: serine hydrolase domain-containing protein [Acidimicrobiales bacterium]|jgi:CubicO group peptidase (beta-lactamase class C family)
MGRLTIDEAALTALADRCHREIDGGILPSCQFAVAKDGEVVHFETIGNADPGSRYVIFSATKAFVAGAFWLLLASEAISVDRRVAEFIPEFGTNGKDAITIRQLLLHQGGFPLAPLNPLTEGTNPARRARFSSWRLNWEPGTRFEYHATSAHWVIADLIETLSGEDFRDFLRTRLLEPLGLRRFQLGPPPEDQGDINVLEVTGEPPTTDELAEAGVPVEVIEAALTDEVLLSLNMPEVRATGLPGGGGISNAADVTLYYQALLHNPQELWDPAVLASGTSEVQGTLPDLLTGVPSNRALGLVVAGEGRGKVMRGFGHTVSARTFGHAGAGGQIAFADPESGISFCYLTNGLDAHYIRQNRRTSSIASHAGSLATPD